MIKLIKRLLSKLKRRKQSKNNCVINCEEYASSLHSAIRDIFLK